MMNLPISDTAFSASLDHENDRHVVDSIAQIAVHIEDKSSISPLDPVTSDSLNENVPICIIRPPTRPMSAYNLFFHLQRQRLLAHDGDIDKLTEENYQYTSDDIAKFTYEQQFNWNKKKVRRPHRKTHGKISFTELAKKIAICWNSLHDDCRNLFHGYFEVEMKRYKKELDEYNKKCNVIIKSDDSERKHKQNKTVKKKQVKKEDEEATRNKEEIMHEVSKNLVETIMETIKKVKNNNNNGNNNAENSTETVKAATKQFLSELLSDTLKKNKKNNSSSKLDNEEDLCDLMTEALNQRRNSLQLSKKNGELNVKGTEPSGVPAETCSIVSSADVDDSPCYPSHMIQNTVENNRRYSMPYSRPSNDSLTNMESETERVMMNSERGERRKLFYHSSDMSVRSAPVMPRRMPMRSSMDHIGQYSQPKKWWNSSAIRDVSSVKSAPTRADCLLGMMKRKQFEMMNSLSYGTTNPNFNQYKRRSMPCSSNWRSEDDEELTTMKTDEEMMMMMMSNQNRSYMNHNNGSFSNGGMNSMSCPTTSSHFKTNVTPHDLMMLRQQNRMLYQQNLLMNQNNFSSNVLNNNSNIESDDESIPNMYEQRQYQQTDESFGNNYVTKVNMNHYGSMNPHAAVDDAYRLACSTIMNDQELFDNMNDDDDDDHCEENEGFINGSTNVLPNFSQPQLENNHQPMVQESFQYPDTPMNPTQTQFQNNLFNHQQQQQHQQMSRRVSVIMSPSSCEDEYDDVDEFNNCLVQQQGQHSMSMMSNNTVSNGIINANLLLSDYPIDTNNGNQSCPNTLHRNNVSDHSFTQSNEMMNNNNQICSRLGNINESNHLIEQNMLMFNNSNMSS